MIISEALCLEICNGGLHHNELPALGHQQEDIPGCDLAELAFTHSLGEDTRAPQLSGNCDRHDQSD